MSGIPGPAAMAGWCRPLGVCGPWWSAGIERLLLRVGVNRQFLFLVTKLSPYYDR